MVESSSSRTWLVNTYSATTKSHTALVDTIRRSPAIWLCEHLWVSAGQTEATGRRGWSILTSCLTLYLRLSFCVSLKIWVLAFLVSWKQCCGLYKNKNKGHQYELICVSATVGIHILLWGGGGHIAFSCCQNKTKTKTITTVHFESIQQWLPCTWEHITVTMVCLGAYK